MPLDVTASRDQAVDDAAQIRLNLGIDDQDDAAVPLHLVGQGALWAGMQELSKQDLEQAEFIGLPIVLIVLLLVFGSLAAAALPLALGVVSVMLTGAVVYFLSLIAEMSIFVTNMASMLGIGVAVDYSLFILARYREELKAGLSHAEAREAAMRTSGMAVVFSGVTVIVALSGLFLIDATVVRSMAVGAIVVVAIAVLAAVTLLPALIAVLGRRVSEPGKIVGRLRRNRPPKDGPGLLAALDGDADEAPAAVRDRRDGADAADRLAGALAQARQRRDRPVPEGLRDPRRLRPRRAGHQPGRDGPDPVRRRRRRQGRPDLGGVIGAAQGLPRRRRDHGAAALRRSAARRCS